MFSCRVLYKPVVKGLGETCICTFFNLNVNLYEHFTICLYSCRLAYHHISSSLSTSQGLVLYGDRIVIPPSMRKEILHRLHDGHQGITKCRERAHMSVWWPGLEKEIQELVTKYPECMPVRPTLSILFYLVNIGIYTL